MKGIQDELIFTAISTAASPVPSDKGPEKTSCLQRGVDTDAGGGGPTTLEPQGVNPSRDRGCALRKVQGKQREERLPPLLWSPKLTCRLSLFGPNEKTSRTNFFNPRRPYTLKKKCSSFSFLLSFSFPFFLPPFLSSFFPFFLLKEKVSGWTVQAIPRSGNI